MVVSFTGTWVETLIRLLYINRTTSYPLRVRGLKQDLPGHYLLMDRVVSFTGTWVETALGGFVTAGSKSRILYGYVG